MQRKSKIINLILLCVVLPLAVIVGYFCFGAKQYYIVAAIVVIAAMTPFFISFEHKKIKTAEVVTIAGVTAIAVASRAVFYMLPQIKPIGAVVIVAAVSFGYETGFMVGALSMLLSDIFFGIGAWTPFQMLGLGIVGLVCALIFSGEKLKNNRWLLGIIGGVVTTVIYGIIVDTNSVLMISSDYSLGSIISVYASGFVFNLIFGVVTAVILIIAGKSFIFKLERLKTKYGIFERKSNR